MPGVGKRLGSAASEKVTVRTVLAEEGGGDLPFSLIVDIVQRLRVQALSSSVSEYQHSCASGCPLSPSTACNGHALPACFHGPQ